MRPDAGEGSRADRPALRSRICGDRRWLPLRRWPRALLIAGHRVGSGALPICTGALEDATIGRQRDDPARRQRTTTARCRRRQRQALRAVPSRRILQPRGRRQRQGLLAGPATTSRGCGGLDNAELVRRRRTGDRDVRARSRTTSSPAAAATTRHARLGRQAIELFGSGQATTARVHRGRRRHLDDASFEDDRAARPAAPTRRSAGRSEDVLADPRRPEIERRSRRWARRASQDERADRLASAGDRIVRRTSATDRLEGNGGNDQHPRRGVERQRRSRGAGKRRRLLGRRRRRLDRRRPDTDSGDGGGEATATRDSLARPREDTSARGVDYCRLSGGPGRLAPLASSPMSEAPDTNARIAEVREQLTLLRDYL